VRRGQPPPCLPVNRVKSGRPMLTAPPGRVRVSPAASTFATLPLLNLSHLLHTSRHQLRRRFSSSLETILNCCFRCLWLNYPATMSPTRHALAEVVPNVNRAPAPTQTKPSRPRQGWPATFQDKENVNIIPSCSPPHRHRHRRQHGRTLPGHRALTRPQEPRSAALASLTIKTSSPSTPSCQIVAAPSHPPISSLGIPAQPTMAATLALPPPAADAMPVSAQHTPSP
jgi:hypothetical protein